MTLRATFKNRSLNSISLIFFLIICGLGQTDANEVGFAPRPLGYLQESTGKKIFLSSTDVAMSSDNAGWTLLRGHNLQGLRILESDSLIPRRVFSTVAPPSSVSGTILYRSLYSVIKCGDFIIALESVTQDDLETVFILSAHSHQDGQEQWSVNLSSNLDGGLGLARPEFLFPVIEENSFFLVSGGDGEIALSAFSSIDGSVISHGTQFSTTRNFICGAVRREDSWNILVESPTDRLLIYNDNLELVEERLLEHEDGINIAYQMEKGEIRSLRQNGATISLVDLIDQETDSISSIPSSRRVSAYYSKGRFFLPSGKLRIVSADDLDQQVSYENNDIISGVHLKPLVLHDNFLSATQLLDLDPPLPSVKIEPAEAFESDGVLTARIVLEAPQETPISFTLRPQPGSAFPIDDYPYFEQQIVIPPGEQIVTTTVDLVVDHEAEYDEVFYLEAINTDGVLPRLEKSKATILGRRPTATEGLPIGKLPFSTTDDHIFYHRGFSADGSGVHTGEFEQGGNIIFSVSFTDPPYDYTTSGFATDSFYVIERLKLGWFPELSATKNTLFVYSRKTEELIHEIDLDEILGKKDLKSARRTQVDRYHFIHGNDLPLLAIELETGQTIVVPDFLEEQIRQIRPGFADNRFIVNADNFVAYLHLNGDSYSLEVPENDSTEAYLLRSRGFGSTLAVEEVLYVHSTNLGDDDAGVFILTHDPLTAEVYAFTKPTEIASSDEENVISLAIDKSQLYVLERSHVRVINRQTGEWFTLSRGYKRGVRGLFVNGGQLEMRLQRGVSEFYSPQTASPYFKIEVEDQVESPLPGTFKLVISESVSSTSQFDVSISANHSLIETLDVRLTPGSTEKLGTFDLEYEASPGEKIERDFEARTEGDFFGYPSKTGFFDSSLKTTIAIEDFVPSPTPFVRIIESPESTSNLFGASMCGNSEGVFISSSQSNPQAVLFYPHEGGEPRIINVPVEDEDSVFGFEMLANENYLAISQVPLDPMAESPARGGIVYLYDAGDLSLLVTIRGQIDGLLLGWSLALNDRFLLMSQRSFTYNPLDPDPSMRSRIISYDLNSKSIGPTIFPPANRAVAENQTDSSGDSFGDGLVASAERVVVFDSGFGTGSTFTSFDGSNLAGGEDLLIDPIRSIELRSRLEDKIALMEGALIFLSKDRGTLENRIYRQNLDEVTELEPIETTRPLPSRNTLGTNFSQNSQYLLVPDSTFPVEFQDGEYTRGMIEAFASDNQFSFNIFPPQDNLGDGGSRKHFGGQTFATENWLYVYEQIEVIAESGERERRSRVIQYDLDAISTRLTTQMIGEMADFFEDGRIDMLDYVFRDHAAVGENSFTQMVRSGRFSLPVIDTSGMRLKLQRSENLLDWEDLEILSRDSRSSEKRWTELLATGESFFRYKVDFFENR